MIKRNPLSGKSGSMAYSTQQLIEILEREMHATCKGERLLLSPAERIDNPVIAKAINLEKVGKVFAYQDFRRQVHDYQQKYQVSGIIWRVCQWGDRTLRYPEIHNQLVAVPLEHQYQWAQPFSGCHRIIAAVDEPSSIKV